MKKIAVVLSILTLLYTQISCVGDMKSDSSMYLDIKHSKEYNLTSKTDINCIDEVSYTSKYGNEIRITTVPFIVPSVDFLSHVLKKDFIELGGCKMTRQWTHEFCNDDKIQKIAANNLYYKNIIRANNDTLEYHVYNDSKFSYCIRTIKLNGAVSNNDKITFKSRNYTFNKDDYQEGYINFLNSRTASEENEMQISNIKLSQGKDSLFLTCSNFNNIDSKSIDLYLLEKFVYCNPYLALSLYDIENSEFKPINIVIKSHNGEIVYSVGIDYLFDWLHHFNTIAPIDQPTNEVENGENIHSPGSYYICNPQHGNPLR